MRKMLIAGLAVLALAAVAGFWMARPDGEAPADGVVAVRPVAPKASASPLPMAMPAGGTANLPSPPDEVIAHVRQAYPLLTKVDFACDAKGCAVTATIPPPTDEAFLAKRQEMLLGGLARVVEGDRYQATGPVQMDEIESNLFHIRLPVTQAK